MLAARERLGNHFRVFPFSSKLTPTNALHQV